MNRPSFPTKWLVRRSPYGAAPGLHVFRQLASHQGNLVLQFLEVASIEWLRGFTVALIACSILVPMFIIPAGVLEGVPVFVGVLIFHLGWLFFARIFRITVICLHGIPEIVQQHLPSVCGGTLIMLQLVRWSVGGLRRFPRSIKIGGCLEAAICRRGRGLNRPAGQIFLVEWRGHI